MYIDRLPDGTLLIELRWQDFAAQWRAVPQASKSILTDGRPAIRQLGEAGKQPSYRTIPFGIWTIVRQRAREAFLANPPAKRERRCQNCDTAMKVAREYAHAWTFKCPKCMGSEIWGKDQVGGTRGAGENEKK